MPFIVHRMRMQGQKRTVYQKPGGRGRAGQFTVEFAGKWVRHYGRKPVFSRASADFPLTYALTNYMAGHYDTSI
jgi:hypothetical protein